MKTHFTFLLFAILTWPFFQPTTFAQNPQTNIKNKGINSIETFKVNPATGEKKKVSTEYFDDLSNRVKRINYDTYPNGGTDEQNCSYDIQGNMKCITTDESGKQTYVHEEKYDGKNMVEEKHTYGTNKFSYDKNDNLILKEEYDSDGTFSQAEKYENIYIEGTSDLKGVITYQKDGNEDFKKFSEVIFTYENGQVIKETYTTNYYYYIYHYEYYANRNLKEKITLHGKKEKVITKYHENGLRRIEAIFRSETEDSEMILDQKNKWTYDEHGNEVMFEAFRNEKLSKKEIREITYY